MRLMNEIVDPTECYVTPRIRHVEQPGGNGYVDPKLFEVVPFDGSGEAVDVLNPGETDLVQLMRRLTVCPVLRWEPLRGRLSLCPYWILKFS